MGIRQWWALTALAAADPAPMSISKVRAAVRVHRQGDPAKDVTDSLLNKGLIKYVRVAKQTETYADAMVRLTHAGWAARPTAAARVEARASR